MPAFSSVGWDCRCRNYITEKTVQEPDSENSKSTRWNNTINPCIFSSPENHIKVHIFCIIQLNYLFFHAD